MRTQLFVAITTLSILHTAGCDDADSDDLPTESQEIRITAHDVAGLRDQEELELTLSPDVRYTFSNEDGPLAYDRITLRDETGETPLEIAAVHIADHYGMTLEGTNAEAFSVRVPGVAERSARDVDLRETPDDDVEAARQVACYWRSPWGEWECDICDWPPEG